MKILLLDIETAPHKVYTWGLFQQNISINQIEKPGYILCWAAQWLGKKKVMFESVQHQSSEDMLRPMYELLDEADVVIHFNGQSFDMKWLQGQFFKKGWPPISPVQQIDILLTVKKKFRLASNKLDYVLKFLGIGAKVKHDGFDMWLGCMAGDKHYWKEMEKYNRGDVIEMAKVYEKILPWIPNHPNHALYSGTGEPTCPNCGGTHLQKRGYSYTKTQTYQRYVCMTATCGTWSRERTNNTNKEVKDNVLVGVT